MTTTLFRSEIEFVNWLRKLAGGKQTRVRAGIGDDAAVVETRPGTELILKSDMSIEGVHFDPSIHPPLSVGHRALARPLSDIGAMGGVPRFALVALAASPTVNQRWIEEFHRGFLRLANRFRVAVVGGDTAVTARGTFIDVSMVGEARKGRSLLRSGARPGDLIYTSGRLGLSRLGLEALRWKHSAKSQGGQSRPLRGWEPAELVCVIKAHLYPEPRIALGQYLAERRLASAAIDVSDGLSTDLCHLVEASGVGARIWAGLLPAPRSEAPGVAAARALGRSRAALRRGSTARESSRLSYALSLALDGGEDYELLFTVPARLAKRLPASYRGVPLRRIGEIVRGRGIALVEPDGRESPLQAGGYDHFSPEQRR